MSIRSHQPGLSAGNAHSDTYTGDGADKSPPLRWSEPPAGTKSIALICDDPDAPRGHLGSLGSLQLAGADPWTGGGVPTTATLTSGANQGKNDFGNLGSAVRRRPRASTPLLLQAVCPGDGVGPRSRRDQS